MSNTAIQNAFRHIDLAERLHKTEENGYAISHLIIGSEELIKALILHLDSIGFNFRQIKGLQNIFENHPLRYFISFIIFTMSIFLDEINYFIKKVNRSKSGFQLLEDLNKEMKENKIVFQQKLVKIMINKLEFLLTEISWFNDLDILRQKGFYVDFVNRIETPLNATESDYLKIKTKVDKVKDSLLELITELNNESESNKELLNKIFKIFKEEKVYKKIESFIKRSKDQKNGPLEYTANSILPFLGELKEKNKKNASH